MRGRPPPEQLQPWWVRSCSRVRPATSGCLTLFWRPVGRPCAIRPQAPLGKPVQWTESEFEGEKIVTEVAAGIMTLTLTRADKKNQMR